MAKWEAIRELGAVVWAWLSGQGGAAELLYAWLQVTTGAVLVDDTERAAVG